jgi:hypothetical protein
MQTYAICSKLVKFKGYLQEQKIKLDEEADFSHKYKSSKGAKEQRSKGAKEQGARVQRCKGAEVRGCRGARMRGCTLQPCNPATL